MTKNPPPHRPRPGHPVARVNATPQKPVSAPTDELLPSHAQNSGHAATHIPEPETHDHVPLDHTHEYDTASHTHGAHPHSHADQGHIHSHDDNGDFHDHHGEAPTSAELQRIGETIWKMENIQLTTVGVDIGSSTSHLMFSRVRLRRQAEGPSSRFVVVSREDLWRSPIHLTPYLPDNTIDADALAAVVHEAYAAAGLERADVDSGAVILTGEALKRRNARAIADLFAAESGKFVCASAGHNLEALLAARGSGAEALSRREQNVVLNVDLGGGTAKFALIRDGVVLETAAVAVGGRLVVCDTDGSLVRIEGPAHQVAESLGIPLELGGSLSDADAGRLCQAWVDILVSLIRQQPPTGLAADLLLTEPLPTAPRPDVITFSGGVAEYVYFREGADYLDFGPALAAGLHRAIGERRIGPRVRDPGQGIRATVVGASQFTVQVSGNTIFIADESRLPIHNLPVLYPRLSLAGDISSAAVTEEIQRALARYGLEEGVDAIALGFRWQGDPYHARLRALADGIHEALPRGIAAGLPIVLLFEGDVAKTIGAMLTHDLHIPTEVVSVDGMVLQDFDYVDIGEVIHPTEVVPVVIKSLLFAGPTRMVPSPSQGEG